MVFCYTWTHFWELNWMYICSDVQYNCDQTYAGTEIHPALEAVRKSLFVLVVWTLDTVRFRSQRVLINGPNLFSNPVLQNLMPSCFSSFFWQVCLEGEISRQSILSSLSRGKKASGDLIPWTVSEQVTNQPLTYIWELLMVFFFKIMNASQFT